MKKGVLLTLVWACGLLFAAWLFSVAGNKPALLSPGQELSPAQQISSGQHCRQQGAASELAWQRVHDGDTLVLEDGRRLRLIGLNAPEVSASGPGEPFADAATRAAVDFLRDSDTVLVQAGADDKDRYGRLLAHVFRPGDGASLAAELISQGLAWQIAVPPNLAYIDCNLAAESTARAAGQGLWSAGYLADSYGSKLQPGFRVLRARIDGITFARSWWLDTDAGFVVRIRPADQVWFERSEVSRWQGQRVEVRGWMYSRAGSSATKRGYQPWVMGLRHPSGLRRAGP